MAGLDMLGAAIQPTGGADMQGIEPQGLSGAAMSLQQGATPDNYLQYVLPGRDPSITPWGQFNVDPSLDFNNIIHNSYGSIAPGKMVVDPKFAQRQDPLGRWADNSGAFVNHNPMASLPMAYQPSEDEIAHQKFMAAMKEAPGISFKDPNLQKAIDTVYGKDYSSGAPYGQLRQVDDTTLHDTSNKLGLTYDDLKQAVTNYGRAYHDIYDPAIVSQQDLIGMPRYKDYQAAIRSQSGIGDNFFADLNKKAYDPGNPYSLTGENIAMQSPGAITGFNPMKQQDWTDYAIGNTPWWMMTPDQREQAQADMAHHNELRSATPDKGGPFDLYRDTGQTIMRGEQGDPYTTYRYWAGSPEQRQYEIAQNALGWNKGEDASKNGYDPQSALNSAVATHQAIPRGKKGKGIFGILSSLASLIPGPQQPFVIGANAAKSFADGNPIGGILGLASLPLPGSGSLAGMGRFGEFAPAINSGNSVLQNVTGSLMMNSPLSAAMADNVVGGITGGLGALGGGGNALDVVGSSVLGGLGNVGGKALGLGPGATALGKYGLGMGLGAISNAQKQRSALNAYKAAHPA